MLKYAAQGAWAEKEQLAEMIIEETGQRLFETMMEMYLDESGAATGDFLGHLAYGAAEGAVLSKGLGLFSRAFSKVACPPVKRGVGSHVDDVVPALDDTDVVRLYHQGELMDGRVSGTRGLSTSTSPELMHYNPDGILFEFAVPGAVFREWKRTDRARARVDLHAPTGIVTQEIRVLPPTTEELNAFIVRNKEP